MAEYIEREALLDSLRGSYNDLKRIYDKLHYDDEKQICSGEICTWIECIMRVKDAPAADVAPVVHGEWKYCGSFLCECQNCGEIYSLTGNGDKDWNYCPHCGTKMDGERRDTDGKET